MSDHRIWNMTTRDFKTYTPSQLFFDPGYCVIDATVGYHEGKYLMAFKDERGENRAGTGFKAIRVCIAPTARGPFSEISDLVSPSLVEGPTLFRANEQWVMLYDYFMDGRYGASVSHDGLHWKIAAETMTFPDGPRHGSVLEIPDEVGAKLRAL